MTVVGEAWVRIRADGKTFPAETKAAVAPGMAEMEAQSAVGGRRAGTTAGKEFSRGSEGALRDSTGRFAAAGETVGGTYASGISRGADGKLRDARGRFVSMGDDMGNALSGGVGNGARKGADAVEGAGKKMGKAAEDSGSHINKLGILSQLGFGRVASAAALGTAGVVAGSVLAIGATVKMASSFQESTTTLVTGAGESTKNIEMVRNGLLNMAGQVGVSANDLAKGMYAVESAGFHGAAGLTIMKTAAEGAKVGGADMATVADTLTSALNAYHQPASKATSVTNDLIATVARGKTHMQDLAGSLGSVLPISAALHVKLPEVTGAMATMTTQGTSAAKAATSLRFLMSALVNPTSKASSTMQDLGLTAKQVGDTLTHKGLQAALTEVTDAAGKKFPKGSAQYTAAIANMVGGTRGMTAALELSGNHAKIWTDNTKAIGKAAGDTSGKVHGWALVQGDFGTQMSRVGAALGAFAIKIGTLLLPPLTAAAKATANFVQWLSGKLGPVLHTVGGYIGGFMHALGGIFTGSGVKGQTSKIGQAFSSVGDVARGIGRVIISYYKGVASVYGAIWQGLVRIVRGVVNTIRGYLADHAAAVHKTFQAIGATLHVIAGVFSTVFAIIRRVVQIAVGIITDLWNRFGKQLLSHIHTELNAIIQVIRGVFTVIRGIFDVVLGILTGKWGRAWRGIKEIVSGIWNVIKGLVKLSMDRISAIIGAGMAVISAVWHHLWGAIKDIANVVWHAILFIVKAVWGAISDYIRGQLHNFVSFWTGIWNTAKHVFAVIWDGIKTVAHAVWGAISDFFHAALHNYAAFWTGAWNGIKHTFGAVWGDIKSAAKTLWGDISGFFHSALTGFENTWKGVWGRVKGVFTGAWGEIKHVAGAVWSGIISAIHTGVRGVEAVINGFITALDIIPFVNIKHIGGGAQGGVVGAGPAGPGGGARGGVLPGYAPGVDSIPFMLSPGEGVLVPEAVKALGPRWVHEVNQAYSSRRHGPSVDGMHYAAAGHAPGLDNTGRHARGQAPISRSQERRNLATAMSRPGIKPGSFMDLVVGPLKAAAEAAMSALGLNDEGLIEGIAKSAIQGLMGGVKGNVTDMLAGGGSNPKRNAVIAYAKKFLGTPYVWGGAEPGGFDCSGLTSFVLDHFNIHPPRTAHEQQKWAPKEPKSQALPADLLFWGNPAHHVAFWLGNNQILQAPHTGANVEISSSNQGSDFAGFGSVPGLGKATTGGGAIPTGGGSPGANRALGMRIARQRSVPFEPLDYIFSHESGWNNTAQSPISTAYGIGQFLDGTWPTYGGKTSDPGRQITDAIQYMFDRYGSPGGAEAYWRVHHNYDSGGWLDPGMTHAVNGTGKKEAIMPEDVMVDAITRSQNPKALLKAVDELTDYAAQIRDLVQAMPGGGGYRGVTSG